MCIYLIRQSSPEALERLEQFEVGEIGVSVITVSELRYGIEKSTRQEQNRRALAQFLLPLEVLSLGPDATVTYGRTRVTLEKRGTPIGPLDTLIAAHALSLGATLVTNNTREFERVPGLNLENWTAS